MTVFVRRNGRFVNKTTGKPMLPNNWTSQPVAMPSVQSDIEPYKSPLGNYMVDGRAARREDLKRNGCREVDPSEYEPVFRSPKLEERYARGKTA